MTQQDFYQVLGIEKGASDDEIKKKYYALAKRFHPDKNDEDHAAEKFKEINSAYEALKDADSRRTYELQKRGEEMEKRFSSHATNYSFFTSPFGPSTRSTFGMGFSANDLHDIFGKAFTGRNKENAKPRARKQDDDSNQSDSQRRRTFVFDNCNSAESKPHEDPNVSFTFSFFEEPPKSSRTASGDADGIFDNFFRDPFFMDSFPFSDGSSRLSSGEEQSSAGSDFRSSAHQEPTSSSRSKPKGPSSSKSPTSSSSKPPTAKSGTDSRPRKEERKKEEERRTYDWQEGLFGRNKTPKSEDTTKEAEPEMKFTCNYCQKKFYAEALSIHEGLCKEKYYGRGPSSNPKPTRTEEKPKFSNTKDDILRNAYGEARKEFIETYISPPKPPSPPPEFLLCEWCGQSFSDGVAKYHIPFCGRKHAAEQKAKEKKKSEGNSEQRRSFRAAPGSARAPRPSPRATDASPREPSSSDVRRPPRDFKQDPKEDPLSRPTYRTTHVTPPRASPSMSRATGASASRAYDRTNSPSFTNLGATRTSNSDGKYLHEDVDDYLYGGSPRRSNPIGSSHVHGSSYVRLGNVGSRDSYRAGSVGRADNIGVSASYGGGGSLGRAEFASAKAAKMQSHYGGGHTKGPEPSAFTAPPRVPTTFISGRPGTSTTRIRYVPAATNTGRPAPLIRVSAGGSTGRPPAYIFRFSRAANGGTI